jgi:hypothetical protein
MDVNDNAWLLDKRVVLGSIASKLAPTNLRSHAERGNDHQRPNNRASPTLSGVCVG